MTTVPLIRPEPPRLSEAIDALRAIEARGIYSNFGPVNAAFEAEMVAKLFDGRGAAVTVCNATIGLMLAIRAALPDAHSGRRRYALMPSFTFAATAQAALWCGLTPLFCDIDPITWAADPADEDRLLRRYRNRIAAIVPYATFGHAIDLARYERLSTHHGIPVIVDAAASLGTLSDEGYGFGTGFSGSVVFSMHATKAFSTGEGGVVYSGNAATVARLRQMANFGFGQPRHATMMGLNAKLTEIGALSALLRLAEYPEIVRRRSSLMTQYRALLPELTFQAWSGTVQAHQFAPVLLPRSCVPFRSVLQARLKARGVESGTYFSPHLAEQTFFRSFATAGALPVTDDVASRALSLPIFDSMESTDVAEVADALRDELAPFRTPDDAAPRPIPSDLPRPPATPDETISGSPRPSRMNPTV